MKLLTLQVLELLATSPVLGPDILYVLPSVSDTKIHTRTKQQAKTVK